MKTKNIVFDLFRYQLLPKNRDFQLDLFSDIKSLDDLLEKKNDIFFTALLQVKKIIIGNTIIRHKVLHNSGNAILYRFAANRSLKRETEDFTEEEIANWPSFYVYVWNNPNQQLIAIQERYSAFQNTEVVAKAIIKAVDCELGKKNLRAHIESLFLENVFWDLIQNNAGKIKDIQFEIITPNMSNISEVLSDELKEFAKITNTAQTKLDIIADPDSTILVDQNDKRIKGLVGYTSAGGGNISLKIKGISKRIHTKKSKKHIEIKELELEDKNPEEIFNIIKGLFS